MKNLFSLFFAAVVLLAGCSEPEETEATLSISSESPFATIDSGERSGKVEFEFSGGQAEILIVTNQPSFRVENTGTEWLTVQEKADRIVLSATINDSDDKLSATVTITAGEGAGAATATLRVSQDKKSVSDDIAIGFDPSEVIISSSGGTEEVIITTNADSWTHSFESDWLTAAVSGDVLSLTAVENEGAGRSVEVTVTATKGDEQRSETIRVTQQAKGEISLSTENLFFGAGGGSQTVEVTASGDYHVGDPAGNWVSTTTDGNVITVVADANTLTDERTTTIVVSTGSGEDLRSAVLNIKQSGNNPNAMKLILNIPADDTMAVLPIYDVVKATVSWGDGTSDTYNGDFRLDNNTAKHVYAKAGTYEVTVAGEVSRFNSSIMGITRNYITEVVQWGNLRTEWMGQAFQECVNLTSIPGDTQGAFRNTITFDRAFSYTGLESIPADLFKYATDAQSFIGTFETDQFALEGTITEIPEGLFANCPKVTTFERVFFGQNNLTSIPEGVFAGNTLVTDFTEALRHTGIITVPENLFANNGMVTTFAYCFSNTGIASVPANLFRENTEVENFRLLFSRCTALRTVPEDLFRYNTKVKDFYSIFAWSGIQSIPAGLFNYNTAVTDASWMFYECVDLTVIPAGLFGNMTSATNIASMFYACQKLETIPENLFNLPQVTNVSNLFYNCGKLTTIPSDLFANMPRLAQATGVFRNCTSLVTIPSQLFAGQTLLTSVMESFMGCSALKNIPADMFLNSSKITSVQNLFRDCTSLQSVPSGVFSPLTNLTNITGLFAGDTVLSTVPTDIFDNNKKLNTYLIAFQNCSSLTGESPYTMVSGQKVHLYERNASNGFAFTMSSVQCFQGATKLSDYGAIPAGWK